MFFEHWKALYINLRKLYYHLKWHVSISNWRFYFTITTLRYDILIQCTVCEHHLLELLKWCYERFWRSVYCSRLRTDPNLVWVTPENSEVITVRKETGRTLAT